METIHVKENIPTRMEDQVVPSVKIGSQTPRQPLVDLKQIARPSSVDVGKSTKSRVLTPLCTSQMKKSQRKIHPATLVYQDIAEKENGSKSEKTMTERTSCIPSMVDIPEEKLDEFVTQVLDKCVLDIVRETHVQKSNESIHEDEIKSSYTLDTQAVGTELSSNEHKETNILSVNEEVQDRLPSEEVKEEIEDLVLDSSDIKTLNQDEKADYLSLTEQSEDSLLGDVSHYTDCSESFSESIKSEEELLASFAEPSEVEDKHSKDGLDEVDAVNMEVVHKKSSAPTPRPTFLEKVAFMQRVKNASSSLASFVFPKGDMDIQLQWIPSNGTAKLTHNVACSPMKISENNPCSCKLMGDNKLDTCVDCARFELSGSKQMHFSESSVDETRDVSPVCVKDTAQTFSHDALVSIGVNTSPTLTLVTDTPVKVITQSASCSPIVLPGYGSTARDENKTQSVMCSPMVVPVSDTAVQNVMETQSVMCSPIPLPVFDASTQNEIEMQSTMCSPIKLQVSHASTQNEIETQSIMCSPMVPCPTQDKSVLVAGPEQVDVGVGTEQGCVMDAGVNVRPDMQTVATEMVEPTMTNCATSMTPLKMNKKQGRKLTAEDIRKQHPRVLANELETLRLENTKLESEVHILERDNKKLLVQENLQQQVENLNSNLEEERLKFREENEALSRKCAGLETQLETLKSQHECDIINIKGDYEKTDYRDHFLSSQKLVRQLQTELEQYSHLLVDIEQSQILQGELEETLSASYKKVKATGNSLLSVKTALEQQGKELTQRKGDFKTELDLFEEEKTKIDGEREQMKLIVSTCKDNMLEMDSEFKNTVLELQTAKEAVCTLQEELDVCRQDLSDERTIKEQLSMDKGTLKVTSEKMNEEIDHLRMSVKQTEEQLEEINKSLMDAQDKHKKELGKIKQSEEEKHLLVVNLQRTLDMREHDIDQLEKDLFECRECIYIQMEASKAADQYKKTTTEQIESLKSENSVLKDCCAVLRAKEQELRGTLDSTLEELNGTKDHATRLLKQQGTEIADCSTAIGDLTDHMTSVLANLNTRAGMQKELLGMETAGSEPVELHTSICTTQPSQLGQPSQNSLVSQILNAAKLLEENSELPPVTLTENGDSQIDSQNLKFETEKPSHSQVEALSKESEVMDSPGTLSRKKLGNSGNSAFAPVKSSKLSEVVRHKESDSNVVDDKIASINEEIKEGVVLSSKGAKSSDQEVGLPVQLTKVSDVFMKIIRTAHLIEKALRSTLQDVRSENDDLNCRVSQFEYTERRLQAELDVKHSELDKNKNMAKQLQEKLEEMSENFGRFIEQEAEVKRQQLEIRQLRGKVQSLDGEKELLNEQIGDLLKQIESLSIPAGQTSNTASVNMDIRSQKDILLLQKKVDKYRNQLLQKEEQIDEISSKAARRIQKLENNWKKADAEVCRFDELVDVIRGVMATNQAVAQNTELRRLVRLIDGQESVSAFNREKRVTESKAHKTLRW